VIGYHHHAAHNTFLQTAVYRVVSTSTKHTMQRLTRWLQCSARCWVQVAHRPSLGNYYSLLETEGGRVWEGQCASSLTKIGTAHFAGPADRCIGAFSRWPSGSEGASGPGYRQTAVIRAALQVDRMVIPSRARFIHTTACSTVGVSLSGGAWVREITRVRILSLVGRGFGLVLYCMWTLMAIIIIIINSSSSSM